MCTERIYLNNDWGFTESFDESMLLDGYNAEKLEKVRLPHNCKEMPFDYFDEHIYQMISGYRKELFAPAEWKGKQILLTFEGAAHLSEVYLNGKQVGEHRCGYTAFTVNLSDGLKYGETNIITVKVNSREDINVPPFGFVIDYMTYGGIYREVYLEIRNTTNLSDIFIRTSQSSTGENAKVISQITVQGYGDNLSVKQYIRKRGTEDYTFLGEGALSGEIAEITFEAGKVDLWDTENPNLYEISTELWHENELLDKKTVTIGFRSAEFRKDGFYLNGKKFKIRGLNRHQSYPYVGYAMPKSIQEADADILKNELGLNAVRTSHYPQSHHFLNRCDEIGLMVFTEIPGWQHIGDEEWKNQAVQNVKDMITQYRSHTSIILWGVRINESQDDDEFYIRTNAAAHELDPSRQTGGVRAIKNSNLLEDVYTYNDFVHCGNNMGCEKKKAVTSNKEKPYMISEFNGHMYPTKAFDSEEHRVEHALRHARVLDAVAGEEDISGCFGWCMADYNTHKDFGSGDRICYHGVLDMFRNHKLAAEIYACQQEKETVLALSSCMDIGEHPGGNRSRTYIFTNADSVKMYKNDVFIKEYKPSESEFKNLKYGPVEIDDFIGSTLADNEPIDPGYVDEIKDALNASARYGLSNLPFSAKWTIAKLLMLRKMTFADASDLYTRYVGNWGGTSTVYSFEAIKDSKVVKKIVKEPMKTVHITAQADHTALKEGNTYDAAAIRIQARDDNGNLLSFFNEPLILSVEGAAELIGPQVISLKGGLGGTYIRTTGETGSAKLTIRCAQAENTVIEFEIN